MNEYHKIQTVFLRDPKTKFRTLLEDQFALPELEYLKDNKWVFTEKVDGTNIRVMWDGKNVTFGGKTDNAMLPSFLVDRLNDLFYKITKKKIFKEIFGDGGNVCLHGEGFGKKIQSGGKYLADEQDFVLFDVKIDGLWLERINVLDIAGKFGLQVVPVIGQGSLSDAVEMTRKGFDSKWGNFTAEGLVMRPEVELRDRRAERIITKIKHKDFK